MARFCVGFVLGMLAILALAGYAQDRSGVITGGVIPSQQQKDQEARKAVEQQYKRLIASTAKQIEPAVQLERPAEKPTTISPGVTPGIGSGTVPPTTSIPASPAPSLPQLAQVAEPPVAQPQPPTVSTSAATFADAEITGSSSAIVGALIPLTVSGFSEDEWKNARPFCEPKGPALRRLKDPETNEDIVFFKATRAGSYTVTVGMNIAHSAWQDHVNQTLTLAAGANVQADLLSELKTAANKLSAAYPVKCARHVVTVDDPNAIQPAPVTPRPAPVPDPIVVVPPVPVPVKPMAVGTIFTVVIGVPESLSPEQNVILDALSQWSDQEGLRGKIGFVQVSPNAIDENGRPNQRVRDYIAEIPPESKGKYPYVFISQVRSGGNSLILDRFEFPADANVIIDKLTRMLESANSRTITPLQGRPPQ